MPDHLWACRSKRPRVYGRRPLPSWFQYFRSAYKIGEEFVSLHLILPATSAVNLHALDRVLRGLPPKRKT